jgi:hypothetical protein
VNNKYEGKKWKDVPIDIRKQLLKNAICLDTVHSCVASEGICLVQLEETLAVIGELHNGKIIIDENQELYNPIIGKLDDNILTEQDEVGYIEYEKNMKSRPHVVLLGAGASVAAIPNGDKNGKKISAMRGFIEKLGMKDIIDSVDLLTESDNLEDIYSELHDRIECKEVVKKLEKHINQYFANYQIPDTPTVYDFLILSLTEKDLIATFNWDPLLLQAYQRVSEITDNLPQLAFLHGNVAVGICEEHKTGGLIKGRCPQCRKEFSQIPLLYPVKEKDYNGNSFIKDSWNALKNYLKTAYMVTIFGYSAPKTDKSAIAMLKEAWGKVEERDLEEIEIIDIRPEEELIESWKDFIHTHHYSTNKSFFEASLGKLPRRSCEATFDRLMNCIFLDGSKGFKPEMTFHEIKEFIKDLLEDEKNNNKILINPYK